MRPHDDRRLRPATNANRHDPAEEVELARPSRRAGSNAGPVLMAGLLMAGLLAAGFLSYAIVLGTDGPLARLLSTPAPSMLPLTQQSAGTATRDESHAHYLVRSTLMALDDAHRTGNYAVLRQLASSAFQRANSVERLADAFAAQRRQDLDLSVAALTLPEWSQAPAVGADNLLRLAGSYGDANGGSLTFALVFAADGGGWKLYEIHVGRAPRRPEAVQAAGLR